MKIDNLFLIMSFNNNLINSTFCAHLC